MTDEQALGRGCLLDRLSMQLHLDCAVGAEKGCCKVNSFRAEAEKVFSLCARVCVLVRYGFCHSTLLPLIIWIC